MERKVKYDLSFKVNCVKLVLENHHSVCFIAKRECVDRRQLSRWLQDYMKHGVTGLVPKTNQTYSVQFKLRVVQFTAKNKLSLEDTRLKFDIPSASAIIKWRQDFAKFGIEGLKPRIKGKSIMSIYKRKSRQSNKPLTKEEELLQENERLRCENAFLKKFNALIQAQEEKPGKQQSKPSKN
ncbi:MAG: transposase [Ignavibacteria bacterium]|nr:transposase [Ignavibacteria bacterium]